jgi:hypothetical protein
MTRIVVGVCRQCGAAHKVKEIAVRANMRYTCRCGWAGTIHVNEALVAQAQRLRAERLVTRNHRNSMGQSRMWTWSADVLLVVSAACLVLALIVPRLLPGQGNRRQMAVLLFALSGASAVGWGFCLAVRLLRNDGKDVTTRKKRRHRRRLL